jgi:hypothetical protein
MALSPGPHVPEEALARGNRDLTTYAWLAAGLLIYALFYVSVAWTGWFDVFFSGAALHAGAKGIDFYQLPNGAWAFWHGGDLTGAPLADGAQYSRPNYANDNVYHPLFTLIFGSLFALLPPGASPYVWLSIKCLLTLGTIVYFFWRFRDHAHIGFAVFVLLVNFSVYLELAAWQFHALLNILLLLFFITILRKDAVWVSGILYGLGLLIKPIGLLFVPVLVFKGRWRVAVIGLGLFALLTGVFLYRHLGDYYSNNLFANLSASGTAGPNQIITLAALLRYSTHWPEVVYKVIQYGSLLLILFVSAFRRVHIVKGFFLLVAYYLCFYQMVFEYQWSTLAYSIAICIVLCPSFQSRLARVCILLTCLPDCFVLLNLLHIDVRAMGYLGQIPGATAWEWMVVSKCVPLLLLIVVVMAGDIQPIWRQFKAFVQALYRVNEYLAVFGEVQEEGEGVVEKREKVWESLQAQGWVGDEVEGRGNKGSVG